MSLIHFHWSCKGLNLSLFSPLKTARLLAKAFPLSSPVREDGSGDVTARTGLGFPVFTQVTLSVPTGAGKRPPPTSPRAERAAGAEQDTGGNAHLGASLASTRTWAPTHGAATTHTQPGGGETPNSSPSHGAGPRDEEVRGFGKGVPVQHGDACDLGMKVRVPLSWEGWWICGEILCV